MLTVNTTTSSPSPVARWLNVRVCVAQTGVSRLGTTLSTRSLPR